MTRSAEPPKQGSLAHLPGLQLWRKNSPRGKNDGKAMIVTFRWSPASLRSAHEIGKPPKPPAKAERVRLSAAAVSDPWPLGSPETRAREALSKKL